ncbi:MAG: zinc metallopeptidase [Brevinema sp.]
MFFFFDPTQIIILPGLIIALWAQFKTQHTFEEWSQVSAGTSAKKVAEDILTQYGVDDVHVEHVSGMLTDHYDPRDKVLRLSDATYHSDSVAAIAVAAHEAGHAIQHNRGYLPLLLRNAIVPAVSIASWAWMILFFIGIFIRSPQMVQIGIWVFGSTLAFSVITLPVEFDASGRALKILNNNGILHGESLVGARKVLTAAALTYIAGALMSLLQLLRLLVLSNMFGGNRD